MDIPGPVGQLETQLDDARSPQEVTAILCHPHPQYGGNMYDGVLHTCTETLLEQGINCIRFNYRGVGASDGTYDNGLGESEDLLAISDWVNLQRTTHKQWWLGYSFGAAVVWRALQAARKVSPAKSVLIAPPTSMLKLSDSTSVTEVTAITGDQDDFVDLEQLDAMQGIAITQINGGNHFFSGHHAQLSQAVAAICGTRGDLSED